MGTSKTSILILLSLVCCLCLIGTPYASAQPANDDCGSAIPVDVGPVTDGTTIGATADIILDNCGISVTAPGVWYKVTGTGTTMTASTCGSVNSYDTKISVFCADCDELTCIGGNDDNSCSGDDNSRLSTVSWCSQAGAEYLILVHGFSLEIGDFQLLVDDDGVACTFEVACIPVGACCSLDDGGCQNSLTREQCETVGGAYQGDNTLCEGEFVDYGDSPEECENGFEDISGTGTEAPNASIKDDDGDVVPIGFEFFFYGDRHGQIGVASNGYLTFGDDLSDHTNDMIPFMDDPNDLIAPYWADLDPSLFDATVHYQTLGTEPNRRFIAQWTDVPYWGGIGANTFQAVLFEGTNCIEFQYGNLTQVSPTVGIENLDGTTGIHVYPAGVTEGNCVSFCPAYTNPIQCPEVSLDVSLDIKPGSCPNPLNTKSQGVLPVAILGNENFDVSKVDVETVQLEGVAPLRSSFEDVATPFVSVTSEPDCNELGPDGYIDLTLKFDTQAVVAALGDVEDGVCRALELTGNLLDDDGGTPFTAEDVVYILKKGNQNASNQNKGKKENGK